MKPLPQLTTHNMKITVIFFINIDPAVNDNNSKQIYQQQKLTCKIKQTINKSDCTVKYLLYMEKRNLNHFPRLITPLIQNRNYGKNDINSSITSTIVYNNKAIPKTNYHRSKSVSNHFIILIANTATPRDWEITNSTIWNCQYIFQTI